MTVEILPQELLELMTPEELTAYTSDLKVKVALDGLFAYMQKAAPADVQEYPHTMLLCAWLDALFDGCLYHDGPGPDGVLGLYDGKVAWVHPERGDPVLWNLAIYMPPRHGKSMTVSNFLPAYLLSKYHWMQVHFATYEAEFAKEWSEKVLHHLNDPELSAFFDVKVKNGRNAAKERWSLEDHFDSYKCAGVGGPITGKGRHAGIADDLIKNAQDANSPTVRKTTNDWWVTTWWSRQENWPAAAGRLAGTPCREILMNTRWHADDISANVVGDDWAVLSLPGLAIDDPEWPDQLGRLPDEPLCPQIKTYDQIIKLDSDDTKAGGMGRQWFAAMWQQRPYIQGGNMIHDPFNLAKFEGGMYDLKTASGEHIYVPEADCMRFGMLDLAASEKTSADFTVLGIFDVTPTSPRRIILRHVIRQRIGTDLHESLVVEGYRRWGLRFIGIEDKTFGTNLINQLRRRGGIVVRSVKADKDKVQRAMPLDDHIKNESLWWMADGAWRQGLEEEVLQFPNAKHDDQVDILAYAARIFESMPQPRKQKKEPVTMDERAAAHIANLKKKRKTRTYNHPELGRI